MMNPEQSFYLLDVGMQPGLSGPTELGKSTRPIPPLSYQMLNKCRALHLLPEGVGYLWENGCQLMIPSVSPGGM